MRKKVKIFIIVLVALIVLGVGVAISVPLIRRQFGDKDVNVTTTFTAYNVQAKVSARYSSYGNWIDMLSNGKKEVALTKINDSGAFKMQDDELLLTPENPSVIFEYKFYNSTAGEHIGATLENGLKINNAVIRYAVSDTQLDINGKITDEEFEAPQIDYTKTKYIYVKIELIGGEKSATVKGSLDWKITFATLDIVIKDDNTQVATIKCKYGEAIPSITPPVKAGKTFKGCFTIDGKMYIDANGKGKVCDFFDGIVLYYQFA